MSEPCEAGSNCLGVYKNKLSGHVGRDLRLYDERTKKTTFDNSCLYFSCYCDTVEELLTKDVREWPPAPRMPIILSDIETFDKVLSLGCPMIIFNNRAGTLDEVHMHKKESLRDTLASVKCIACGKRNSERSCEKCSSASFCRQCFSKPAKVKKAHSDEMCMKKSNTPVVKPLVASRFNAKESESPSSQPSEDSVQIV